MCVFAFDCLSLNGRTLLQEPLTARREALYSALAEDPGHLQFATTKVGSGAAGAGSLRQSGRCARGFERPRCVPAGAAAKCKPSPLLPALSTIHNNRPADLPRRGGADPLPG